MGQSCCSQCNTKLTDQFTLECDEGTDSIQVEAIKSQLKFLNTYSIPIVLQSDQFKSEFLKDINVNQKHNRRVNLMNLKVQSIVNDPLGLYVEQQFNYEMNRYQLSNPILIVNLITDWQKMKQIIQQKLSLDQCMFNILLQESQGNKFIHYSNDRIMNQFCNIQMLQELFISIDNSINMQYYYNNKSDQNKIDVQPNDKVIKEDQITKIISQISNEDFIYIPVINLKFKEYNLNGQLIDFIDCRRLKLIGYSNFEFLLKQTQILYKSMSILQQQQLKTSSMNVDIQNQINNTQIMIQIIVLHKNDVQVQTLSKIKSNNIDIYKYVIKETQALVLRQRIRYQQNQLTFLIAEPVQRQLTNQFIDECMVDKTVFNNNVTQLDKQIYNLRKVIFEHLNRTYIQSCKDIQKPEFYQSYAVNSLIYYFKRNQMQIFQILNQQLNENNGQMNQIIVVTKNSHLKPQDVINMSEITDSLLCICSNIIMNEYLKKQFQEINEDQQPQQISNQNLMNIIEIINNKLESLKQNNNQNIRIESENFYTEGIQEQDIKKQNVNMKQQQMDRKNQQQVSQKQNSKINQMSLKEQDLNSLSSPIYREKNIKYNYTPIQDTAFNSDQVINSLPISPSNFHDKKESNFTSPKQLQLLSSPKQISSQKQFYLENLNNNQNNNNKKKQDSFNNTNKSNFAKIKDEYYRDSNQMQSQDQSLKTKNVNFDLYTSNHQQSIQNNEKNKKFNITNEFNEDGYDSPTFLSSKNLNSSFNVIDQLDNNQNTRRSHKQNNQIKFNNINNNYNNEGDNVIERNSTVRNLNNSMNYSKLDIFQRTELYNKKLDLYLGCVYGSFLGDSMGLYIRHKKQFSVTDIQISMNMDYQPTNILPNPGQLSEISEISLEIGYALSSKQGIFDQKDIIMNMIEWYNSRPPFNQEQKMFYKVLKQVSSIQDEIKTEDMYKIIQQKCSKQQNENNQVELLARICFLAVYTSAILDEDMIKIIKSQINLFDHPLDLFLLDSCLIYCYAIKQSFNSNLDRHQIFEKTLQFCQKQLKDNQLYEILLNSSNPIMKVFDHQTIIEKPLQFIIYLSFYFFQNQFSFGSALQNVYSYGGFYANHQANNFYFKLKRDTCLFGSIVGCLLGSVNGYNNLPQFQLQKMINLNPENMKYFIRPERYSPKYGYNIAKDILEFYFSKD